MIKGLAISTVWVLDQDRAREFYTEKLGLEVRTDMTMGEGGMRWLTVGAPDQPEVELTLMVPGPPAMDPESAEMMKKLVAKGALGAG
ncbi:VOC family protein, partial [Streptomyces anthocyanicus]